MSVLVENNLWPPEIPFYKRNRAGNLPGIFKLCSLIKTITVKYLILAQNFHKFIKMFLS